MNPIVFAMRHPITVMVALAGVLVASGLALLRMQIDIFPNLNLPVVYVVQPYGGMDPAQMEGLLTIYYEYHFLYISGIHHVESQQHPGLRPDEAVLPPRHRHGPGDGRDGRLGQPRSRPSCRRARWRRSSCASTPAASRSATSCCPARPRASARSRTAAYIRVRPAARQPAGRVGAAAVRRQPAHHRRPRRSGPAARLQSVARRGGRRPHHRQRHQPFGQRSASQDSMPIVPVNAMVGRSRRNWGTSRSGPAPTSTCATSGHRSRTAADIPTSYALVNGRRAVYILVTKRADASTLAVVNNVKAEPAPHAGRPAAGHRASLRVRPVALRHAARCGASPARALGAVLTGLMVLLFLRDWRSGDRGRAEHPLRPARRRSSPCG